MTESRFRLLGIELIARGVAWRHARRAVLELEGHHRELVERALTRGEAPQEAERIARDALGSDAAIIERYAQQRELQSGAHRWRAAYLVAPLLAFAIVFVATLALLVAILRGLDARLRLAVLPAALSHGLGVAVGVWLAWVLPLAVASGFGVLAGRQSIRFPWLSGGIAILSVVAAQINVRCVVTGGPSPGLVGAGIGFSTRNLPHELLHMLAMAALTLLVAGWLRHRESSGRLSLL